MNKFSYLFAPALVLATIGSACAQDYPIMDMVADNVIQKYQQATCEELWLQKGAPKTPSEVRALHLLQGDPAMRTAFINKVAPTIVNKMFSCGMIP